MTTAGGPDLPKEFLPKKVLPIAEVVRYAREVGFAGEKLITIVAIAAAESGFDTHAIGDVNLTERGEMSVGLWQINYRPSRDKKTSTRWPRLNVDPLNNALAAYAISRGASTFKPWSVYTTGAYKKHLDAARAAVGGSTGGTGSTGTTAGTTESTTEPPSTPVLANASEPIGPLVTLRIGGQQAAGELGNAVVGGQMDLSAETNVVSELTVELEDKNLELIDRFRLNIGSPLDYQGLRWQVVEMQLSQGPANPHLTMVAHPLGAVRMRTGIPTPARGISPTDYMKSLATQAGLKFIGEPSAPRNTIAPKKKTDQRGSVSIERDETAWEVGQDWAAQLGFYAFEAGGTYYFGSPFHLAKQGRRVQLTSRGLIYGRDLGPVVEMIGTPTCTASQRSFKRAGTVEQNATTGTTVTYYGTLDSLKDVAITARVEREPGLTIRPGMSAAVSGTGAFDSVGLLVRRVKWDLLNIHDPVTVEVGTAETLASTGRTEQDTSAATGTTTGGAPKAGSKLAVDMVTYMLRQVGDTYVYGAEVRLDDVDPDRFDCSELIEWACHQVGVKFVDGSINQIGAARRAGLSISVEQAAKTRGALLWTPGHIAVSLGDGKSTVEARGRKYGVVQHIIGNRFREGGKIPGLKY